MRVGIVKRVVPFAIPMPFGIRTNNLSFKTDTAFHMYSVTYHLHIGIKKNVLFYTN